MYPVVIICRWLRLRLNMMPITAGFLEPLGESVPLGIYASWSAQYLFGVNPYLWFAGHWLAWIILDYLQLKGVQVNYSHLLYLLMILCPL